MTDVTLNGRTIDTRRSIAADGYLGELLSFAPAPSSVMLPNSETIALEGATFVPTTQGWHTFRGDGWQLRVLVFELNAVDLIPAIVCGRTRPRTLAERRLVLRSAAIYGNPSGGTKADLCGVCLAQYGA